MLGRMRGRGVLDNLMGTRIALGQRGAQHRWVTSNNNILLFNLAVRII